jgi:hypothetical protein
MYLRPVTLARLMYIKIGHPVSHWCRIVVRWWLRCSKHCRQQQHEATTVTHTYTHTHTYKHINTHKHPHTQKLSYTHTKTHIHKHKHTHTNTYEHKHKYTHTHKHKHSCSTNEWKPKGKERNYLNLTQSCLQANERLNITINVLLYTRYQLVTLYSFLNFLIKTVNIVRQWVSYWYRERESLLQEILWFN